MAHDESFETEDALRMKSRPLTSGEIQLARSVFGSSIDYAAVRIHRHAYWPFQPRRSAMAPNGHIYLRDPKPPGSPIWSEDFSRSGSSGLFIHELVHVWQKHQRVLNPILAACAEMIRHRGRYSRAYAFELEPEGKPQRDLLSFRIEQQAAIVERWYRETQGCKSSTERQLSETEPLRQVLAKFLEEPSYPTSRW